MELTEEIKEKLRKEIKERIENTDNSRLGSVNSWCRGTIIFIDAIEQLSIIEDLFEKDEGVREVGFLKDTFISFGGSIALRLYFQSNKTFIVLEGVDYISNYIECFKEVVVFSDLLKKYSK